MISWNSLVLISFTAGVIGFIGSLATYIAPKTKKIKSLFYIRLGLIFMSIYSFFEAFSVLFMSIEISWLSAFSIILAAFFFSIGINYIFKETYISLNLIFISCLSVLIFYFALQPGAFKINKVGEFTIISWIGLFGFFTDILSFSVVILLFYWGFKTWINSPFLIKKEASFFLLGIFFLSIFNSMFLIFRFSYPIMANALFFILGSIAMLIISIVIIKEPKLLYIFPFTIYRIIVKDKEGYPLFDHDWTESEINELMFTGFINAVQLMSKEVMHIGGLVDINLEKGILILYETKRITVGLVASKSSKLIRDILVNFSDEFEQKFERELKKSIKDMTKYEPAYLLIDKYFSNFPFKLIPSKKHPLALSGKYAKIPLELENKIKNIFTDDKEYEFIKSELLKSPACVLDDFIDLFNELKEESDKLSNEDIKDLEYDN